MGRTPDGFASLAWSMLPGRVAWQFIQNLAGELGQTLD